VEADRGLVEDVEDAREATADLRREAMRWLSPPERVPLVRSRWR